MIDEVTKYAERVASGKKIAGKFEIQACERHLRFLDRNDIWFDVETAAKRLAFFPQLLKHYKGEKAGQPLKLEGWQKFNLGSIFGWKKKDGSRLFNYAYTEVARKNGKTTMAAGGTALKSGWVKNTILWIYRHNGKRLSHATL